MGFTEAGLFPSAPWHAAQTVVAICCPLAGSMRADGASAAGTLIAAMTVKPAKSGLANPYLMLAPLIESIQVSLAFASFYFIVIFPQDSRASCFAHRLRSPQPFPTGPFPDHG